MPGFMGLMGSGGNISSLNNSGDMDQLTNLMKLKMLQDKFNLLKNRSLSDNRSMESIGYWLAVAFVVFGCVAVLLNISILIILWINKRKVFRHVFYILLVNFSVIDLLRGLCLIMWALKILSPASSHGPLNPNAKLSILILKMDQIALTMLRFCNLGTILNLLMITLNEFLFIKYPLRYNSWVTRPRAVFLAIFSGICCFLFTLFSTFIRAQSNVVGVDLRCRARLMNAANSTRTVKTSPYNNSERITNIKCIQRAPADDDDIDPNQLLNYVLIAFCAVCVCVVIVCYAIFFNIIRQAKKQDDRILAEMEQYRRSSSISQADRRVSDTSCVSTMEGPLQKGRTSLLNNSSDQRQVKRQLLKRYKYVLVIGFVIVCYVLYLGTYSTIQILQFTVLRPGKRRSHRGTLIVRYVLQLLVGLHSVLQPMCYFRNKEFRQYVRKACASLCYCICRKRFHNNDGGDTYRSETNEPYVTDSTCAARKRSQANRNGAMVIENVNNNNNNTARIEQINDSFSNNALSSETPIERKTSVVQFSTVLVTNDDIDESRVHFV